MARQVIRQHHARSMHFDFRLEVAGSEVDDHPLSWGDFEGVIPKGEYGGGPVIVWDRGTYENLREEPMEEALDAGHASFRLEGEKLRGGCRS